MNVRERERERERESVCVCVCESDTEYVKSVTEILRASVSEPKVMCV